MIGILLPLLAATGLNAFAVDQSEIEKIRQMAPAGYDLAKVKTLSYDTGKIEAVPENGETSYLFGDFNRDGNKDLMVIWEKNPFLSDEKDQPCEKEDYKVGCWVKYQQRLWYVYYGQRDGTLKVELVNDKTVLQADEGGVWGDPLVGFTALKTGAVTLDFYGGSSWRWGHSFTVQFRPKLGDIYVIGSTTYAGWTGDGRGETVDTNLITGDVIETSTTSFEEKETVKKYKVERKPLVKLRNFSDEQFGG